MEAPTSPLPLSYTIIGPTEEGKIRASVEVMKIFERKLR